ncbi:hypothetical protein D5086_024295 [Populus alba]|uniref:Uncharacterized protein n=1 Tax=Populus alba TaxID=43335 RepID=A0ACC4B6K7_POPAL
MEVAATGKAVCRATKMGAVWDRDRDRDRGASEKLSQQGTKGTSPTRSGWNRLRTGFNGEEREMGCGCNTSPNILPYTISFTALEGFDDGVTRLPGIGSQPRSLSLSCGSENGGTDGDGRKWESDVKYIAGNYPHARAQYQDSSIVSEVPYMDARIFISEVTYNLPIMLKTRYWLRLYFYPSEYSGLNITNSYFSVVAGGVTLLNNFSASITAQALTQAYLIKEYSLAPMNHQILNVTFKPADRPDAFAFINAIELVPMTDLFGSGTMVGFSDQNFDAVSANLETMYRLNVAGQYISPTKDSGNLTRTWYNDAPYLFGAATGVNLQTNESFKVQYGELTESVAPPDVYRTARGMGYHKDLNLAFNLTWLFQADANFTYVVRLHFCEFQLTKVNQKVFNIYINNQTAQVEPNAADIIGWTGEIGVPTYKDYAVFVKDRPGDEEIRVDLHPATYSKPEFYDATINGIEVFKMSDRDNNLAGPNPVLSEMQAQHIAKASNKKFQKDHKTLTIVGTAGGVGFFFVAAACIAAYRRKKIIPGFDSHTSSWLPVYGNSHTGPDRPNMGDVLWNLELSLQLQDSPEGSKRSSEGEGSETSEESVRNRNLEMHYSNLSLGSNSEKTAESDDSVEIFSQIVNPKGR